MGREESRIKLIISRWCFLFLIIQVQFVVIMDGAGSIPGTDEGDHEDDEGEDFILLESVNCLGCGAVLSDRENFIEVIN